MQEIWKEIPWYEWLYQVSNLGRVRSFNTIYQRKWKWVVEVKQNGVLLSITPYTNWYLRVWFVWKCHLVHKLVMLAFVWPRPEWHQINHIDHSITNNRLDNLEYCTPEYNNRRKVVNGRSKTEKVMKHIYDVHITNKWNDYWNKPCMQLTKDYKFVSIFHSISEASKVTWVTYYQIVNFRRWKWTWWWFIRM